MRSVRSLRLRLVWACAVLTTAWDRNTAVDLLQADLSSQQSIRQLVENFQRHYPHLHVLINNVRTGTPLGRNGSHRQLPASWLRGNTFRAEGCRTRLSPARKGDRELWHEPRKGGENLDLPGLLTRGGRRHRQLLCEEHSQAVSCHLL